MSLSYCNDTMRNLNTMIQDLITASREVYPEFHNGYYINPLVLEHILFHDVLVVIKILDGINIFPLCIGK